MNDCNVEVYFTDLDAQLDVNIQKKLNTMENIMRLYLKATHCFKYL